MSSQHISKVERKLVSMVHPCFNQIFWTSAGSLGIELACQAAALQERRGDILFGVADGAFHGNTFFASTLTQRFGRYRNLLGKAGMHFVIPGNIQEMQKNSKLDGLLKRKHLTGVVIDPLAITGDKLELDIDVLEETVCFFRHWDVPVIFDEVACGCHRHGYFSVGGKLKTPPDFIVLSKGLTSGLVPLAATLINQNYLEKIDSDKLFKLGHTFGITPFSATALDWVTDRYEELIKAGKLKAIETILGEAAKEIERNCNKIKAEHFALILRLSIDVKTSVFFRPITKCK
jgi:adenosylmethionine-8-amino-7-oxononanoate aminotransferase